MFTLILDTSTEKGIVALARDFQLLMEIPLELKAIRGSTLLVSSVKHLLSSCHVTMSQLKVISVGVGPGSFTGIRVAASFAKGLSVSLGIPLIGFSSLLGFVSFEQGPFSSVIPTNKGGSYVLERFCKNEEIEELSEPKFIPDFSPQYQVISSKDYFPSGKFLAKMAERRYQQKKTCSADLLEMCYLTDVKIGSHLST